MDMPSHVEVIPIGRVQSPIQETLDDVWGDVTSRIELDESQFTPDCLAGLDQFSHVEVIFLFNRVENSEVQFHARRPRGRTAWPLVGIFAQRAKNRPNRMGVTVCRLLSVQRLSLVVEDLDGPRGQVRQPAWATELMSAYWKSGV
jgi:tRNA (Thr-GGU) A37 N-methylase